jgi:hypothetical protein
MGVVGAPPALAAASVWMVTATLRRICCVAAFPDQSQ